MYNIQEISKIKTYMLKRQETLSVAESVTSGHLQAALSLADGATDFFQGGITAYNLGQKSRHLKIEPIHAFSNNCVSQKVAQQMAIHSCEFFSSDWGLAITGYAAPVPELGIKSLFAFYAIAFRDEVVQSEKLTTKEKNIYEAQVAYSEKVLADFAKYLTQRMK